MQLDDRPPLGNLLGTGIHLMRDQPLPQAGIGNSAMLQTRILTDQPGQPAFFDPPALGTGDIDARVGRAFKLQQAFANRPATVNTADHVIHLGNGILKAGFTEGRGAGNQRDWTDRDALLVHVHQNQADPFMLWLFR